jgi:CBS domain-containing protein/sporulation protein YlmC with PRC-barrel domain
MPGKNPVEEAFYLTELLGARVYANDRKLGKLKDVVAVDQGKLAEVTHFQIGRPFGDPSLLVPLPKVRSFGLREIVLENGDPDSYVRALQPEEVLLRDYLLDKKVLDMEDREVEVVYDMRLVRTNGKIYVSDVDISRYGLLRQLGLTGLANRLSKRDGEAGKNLIPWSYVQPLSPHLGALEGNLKLNVLKEELAEIHPVDLADILEELDSPQRATIMEGLDTEHASDTLEEIEPAVQRDIVRSLRKDRVAELIREMTPGQAADILSVLPSEDKKAILKLLEPSQVAKIEQILEKQDIDIISFATHRFFKFPPDITVEQAQVKCREMAKQTDVVMYLYIVDPRDKLLGVADIKDLFMAGDNELLGDLMAENVIVLNPGSTMKEAVDLFNRYHFEALPVVGVSNIILGVVPYRDAMNLKHRMLE